MTADAFPLSDNLLILGFKIVRFVCRFKTEEAQTEEAKNRQLRFVSSPNSFIETCLQLQLVPWRRSENS
ncbi:hypothetical protein P8452_28668 [Trifolium repens]|nr:hypothetical protein P8452_28668 [Trifolium repens]